MENPKEQGRDYCEYLFISSLGHLMDLNIVNLSDHLHGCYLKIKVVLKLPWTLH